MKLGDDADVDDMINEIEKYSIKNRLDARAKKGFTTAMDIGGVEANSEGSGGQEISSQNNWNEPQNEQNAWNWWDSPPGIDYTGGMNYGGDQTLDP